MSRSFGPRAATLVALASASVCALVAGRARADDLRVSTLGGGSWAAAVAQLESDVHGEGRIAPVVVDDSLGRRVPCGRYRLLLDAAAARAFSVDACDPATQATTVTLVHRDALFDAREMPPVPLFAGISAVEVLTGGERGGAGIPGGSTLHCTIDVRPYLMDLLHGVRVFLTPARYVLRPAGAGVVVTSRVDGWTLATSATGTLVVEYDVLDAQHGGAVVVHDRATLSCGNAPSGGPRPAVAQPGVPTLGPSVAPVRGAAEVDGRGLPLSAFSDILPVDRTSEQPSPWVRSRVTCVSPVPPERIDVVAPSDLRGTTEVRATVVVDASDDDDAMRLLRQRASGACADTLTQVSIVRTSGAAVHAVALAVRKVASP